MSTETDGTDNPGPILEGGDTSAAWWAAVAVGGVGLSATAVGVFLDPADGLQGYLVGFFYMLGIPVGALGLTLLHHLVGGDWGEVIRGPMEAAMMTMPVAAVAVLPVAVGVWSIYPWAGPEAHVESPYLSVGFFWIRIFVYFAVWVGTALWLYWDSPNYHAGLNTDRARWTRKVAAGGLLAFFLTTTFAYIDWGMSLDPHWLSTIWGLMHVVGHTLLAFASLLVVVAVLARGMAGFAGELTPGRLKDLGNLLLVFVILWAYTSFAQYLIIWSGDKAHEIGWYLARNDGGWEWFPPVLIVLHFAIPLVALLFRPFKRSIVALGSLAAGLVVMRFVDTLWVLAPSFAEQVGAVHWTAYTSMLGLVGVVVAVWLSLMVRRPLFDREHFGRSTSMETAEIAHVPD